MRQPGRACRLGHDHDDRAPFKADTRWSRAILSADGMTLTISVAGAPAGDGPCEERFLYHVTETDHSVTVAFRRATSASTTAPIACPDVLVTQRFDIRLHAPLGDRPLYDAIGQQPRPVWHVADVVRPTVLPGGITVHDLTPTPGSAPLDWSQSAQVTSGPGWDLWIDQGPAGSFTAPSTAPAKVVATTEVHGSEAKIYEYFNSTGHLIHWTEHGLDVTVRAELHTGNMSEPQSFANPQVAFIDPLLVRIAGGIVVPARTASGGS